MLDLEAYIFYGIDLFPCFEKFHIKEDVSNKGCNVESLLNLRESCDLIILILGFCFFFC